LGAGHTVLLEKDSAYRYYPVWFQTDFQDVLAIGLPALLIDIIIVVVTICGGIYLGKLLKMDRGIALLTSIGSGICGAAAILGAESTIKAKPYKTAVSGYFSVDNGYDCTWDGNKH